MSKETLARAKELEKEILQMETALGYYKRQRWGHWDINDRASSMHFEYCKNWSGRDADRQDLPKRLDAKLMAVVERELAVARQELDALGSGEAPHKETFDEKADRIEHEINEQRERIAEIGLDLHQTMPYNEGDHVTINGNEYEYRDGILHLVMPGDHRSRFTAAVLRTLDRMASWVIYSLLFCLLFGLAGWQYTTRELIALSLAIGFFAGSINNIERVLRELFEKKDKED